MSNSPLKGPIATQVHDGLSDVLYELTYTVVEESFDPSTGETVTTETEYTCRGFVGEFSKEAVSDGLVQQNDSKIMILQPSLTDSNGDKIEPSPGHKITDDGDTYEIPDAEGVVQSDPASATWTVQGRE